MTLQVGTERANPCPRSGAVGVCVPERARRAPRALAGSLPEDLTVLLLAFLLFAVTFAPSREPPVPSAVTTHERGGASLRTNPLSVSTVAAHGEVVGTRSLGVVQLVGAANTPPSAGGNPFDAVVPATESIPVGQTAVLLLPTLSVGFLADHALAPPLSV